MEAGRELDALIAEKVMGWERGENWLIPPVGTPMRDNNWAAEWDEKGRPHWLPRYSQDIEAAWQVVEKLRKDWEYLFINAGNGWGVECRTEHVDISPSNDITYQWTESTGNIHGDTAPLAICLAALKAVGVE